MQIGRKCKRFIFALPDDMQFENVLCKNARYSASMQINHSEFMLNNRIDDAAIGIRGVVYGAIVGSPSGIFCQLPALRFLPLRRIRQGFALGIQIEKRKDFFARKTCAWPGQVLVKNCIE